jgi:hypothetical protein
MSNPFEYVNQILYGKKNLIVDENSEKEYNPFLTNRSLSYHFDTVLYANEMNQRSHLDKKLQFDFFINITRSKKRPFVKWVKPEDNDNMEYIKKVFDCSNAKALDILRLLNHEQIQKIKEQADHGGLRK